LRHIVHVRASRMKHVAICAFTLQYTTSSHQHRKLYVIFYNFVCHCFLITYLGLGIAKRNIYCHVRLCACLCVSVLRRILTLLHAHGCNFGEPQVTPICALLGGFAIDARVSLLWQHTRLMRNASEYFWLATYI